MKAYWFRFLDEAGSPTGWGGLAFGDTMKAVLEEMEYYCDYRHDRVQMRPAKAGVVVFAQEDSGGIDMEDGTEDFGIGFDDEGWVTVAKGSVWEDVTLDITAGSV